MGGLMRMVAAMVKRGRIRARDGWGVELFRGRLSVVHLPLWPPFDAEYLFGMPVS